MGLNGGWITTGKLYVSTRKTKSTQTWKITFHFENNNMRNNKLQPGAVPIDSIHNKIYPIFYNQYQNPQRDFSIQLAVATFRLGSNGNGAAVLRLKNLSHLGHRTINLYTTQVIKAINISVHARRRLSWIYWFCGWHILNILP
ncbi:uncharacterized protein VP01_2843g2 [Puccinia sorghi]|uniref:Uncharacterized protein n=1 Tax=Puccinia sorghi TaxID=27349 RepID=A0A0L6V2V9_9BASI|nr:uncharacterized protein VP01_2843g2 [Puccinia sorghi]